ncbi:MAG: aldo/keto reductase [Myxococcota bacterium]|nr:aldo/keto reductase [Myxococcota bacterium]
MKAVSYGNSGLMVSPICLGTMMFGGQTPDAEARRIADFLLERGVFFWDTADMYSLGRSESVCGSLLKGRRNRVVLATKVYAAMSEEPNDRGLSARHIVQACEDSLRRLQTDWIDIYYMHLPDKAPVEETLRTMEDLCRSGKVRYSACSNYRAWETLELWHLAKNNGWQAISGIQPLYNIVNRDIEVEMLPMARAKGLGVVTYSPLARGVLTGKYGGGDIPAGSRLDRKDRRFLQAEWREESVRTAEQLRPLAKRLHCTLSQLATAWVLNNVHVDSVIIGPRTFAQAEDAVGAIDVMWDSDAEDAVDALIPPGCHSGKAFFDVHYAPVTGRKSRV